MGECFSPDIDRYDSRWALVGEPSSHVFRLTTDTPNSQNLHISLLDCTFAAWRSPTPLRRLLHVHPTTASLDHICSAAVCVHVARNRGGCPVDVRQLHRHRDRSSGAACPAPRSRSPTLSTQAVRTTVTAGDGTYLLTNLDAGTYLGDDVAERLRRCRAAGDRCSPGRRRASTAGSSWPAPPRQVQVSATQTDHRNQQRHHRQFPVGRRHQQAGAEFPGDELDQPDRGCDTGSRRAAGPERRHLDSRQSAVHDLVLNRRHREPQQPQRRRRRARCSRRSSRSRSSRSAARTTTRSSCR